MPGSGMKMNNPHQWRAACATRGIGFGPLKTQRKERLFVMDKTQRGKLILKTVPAGEVEKKVVMLLLKFSKGASADTLTEKIRNTPYELSNDIEAQKAVMFIEAFQKCGATAVFIPHVTAKPIVEKFTPVKKQPDFSFGSPSTDKAAPPPIRVKPEKNGVRRLTMTLVIILLLLSFGYLTWQLWPILGVKIQELVAHLKQLF